MPVETDFGTKRKIDQASCNKDFSCLNGFCPSFITVHNAEPRKPSKFAIDEGLFEKLPDPVQSATGTQTFNLMIAGIGGTGVTTVAAVLGMAAHIDGLAASSFDMTGMAQKNGAVFSHIRIAATPAALHAQKLGRAETDLLLAYDLVAALGEEARSTLIAGRSKAIVNGEIAATAAFQFDRDALIDKQLLLARLGRQIGNEAITQTDATAFATTLFGDPIGANFFIVGEALQRGLLPFGVSAVEEAIRLNGTAVAFNLTALRLGRLYVVRPEKVLAMMPASPPPADATLASTIARRVSHLTKYQSAAYADRYRSLVERVAAAEARIKPGSDGLSKAAARVYAKFLAYKDEFEVARILSSPELAAELKAGFANGASYSFNLAPPILGGTPANGRPRKRTFNWRLTKPILSMLAHLKFLRGTPFDPFGYFAERKKERALATQYEELTELVLSNLTPGNHRHAVKLLGLGNMVRGYGPVKAAAMSAYDDALIETRRAFLQDHSSLDVAA